MTQSLQEMKSPDVPGALSYVRGMHGHDARSPGTVAVAVPGLFCAPQLRTALVADHSVLLDLAGGACLVLDGFSAPYHSRTDPPAVPVHPDARSPVDSVVATFVADRESVSHRHGAVRLPSRCVASTRFLRTSGWPAEHGCGDVSL